MDWRRFSMVFLVAAELDKFKARIANLEPTETITACRDEAFLEDVKKRHAEEVELWKETSAENEDSLIIDVNAAKADSGKMSGERNLILTGFEEHVRAMLALVNANVEPKVALKDAMTTVSEQLEIWP